jgi:hypothetical protein
MRDVPGGIRTRPRYAAGNRRRAESTEQLMLVVLLILGFLLLAPARLIGRMLFRILLIALIIAGVIALVGGPDHPRQPVPNGRRQPSRPQRYPMKSRSPARDRGRALERM